VRGSRTCTCSDGLPCGCGVAGEQYRPGPVQQTVELERPDLVPEGTVVAVVRVVTPAIDVHPGCDVGNERLDSREQRGIAGIARAARHAARRPGRLVEQRQEPGALASWQPGRVIDQDLAKLSRRQRVQALLERLQERAEPDTLATHVATSIDRRRGQ
jgi:hypothetical protein